MNRTTRLITFLLLLILPSVAMAQTNAFSYQGSLTDSGGMADGVYDFRFSLYSVSTDGSNLGTDEHLGVQVTDGLFGVELDFGASAFETGADRYLEIEVRFDGDVTFTTLVPRVQLDSVPFSAHADGADIADYALAGPFEPRDSTPASRSGVSGPIINTTLTIGGNIYTTAEPIFPIQLSRDILNTGSQLIPGNYHDFTIELAIPYNASNQLRNHFDQIEGPVQIVIEANSTGFNQTAYTFTDGIFSGYRLEQDQTLVEVITVSFSQQLQNPMPVSEFVSRDTNGFNPVGHGPYAPYLGGDHIAPGNYFYAYDGTVPADSSVGIFPGEERYINNGTPTPFADQRPLTLLLNVHQDQFNILWDRFASGNGGAEPLDLRDSSGVIWNAPSASLISSWTLDIADDGGLFETYEFQYIATP